MDFNQNSTGAFINPHAKRPAAENAASESNNRVNNVPVDSAVADFFTMGIQSQSCNGTVENCKKRATKRKAVHKQHAMGRGDAFVSHLHCCVREAQRLKS
jgi:hypothetical protein